MNFITKFILLWCFCFWNYNVFSRKLELAEILNDESPIDTKIHAGDEILSITAAHIPVMAVVVGDNELYTGTLISTDIIITSAQVAHARKILYCMEGEICDTPLTVSITDPDIGFVKLRNPRYEYRFEGDRDKINKQNCSNLGIRSDVRKITITGDDIQCDIDCEHMDAVVCENMVVGVIAISPAETKLITIQEMKTLLATARNAWTEVTTTRTKTTSEAAVPIDIGPIRQDRIAQSNVLLPPVTVILITSSILLCN